MLHPSVERELFGRRRQSRHHEQAATDKTVQLPRRHIAIALLIMTVLGSWAMDLLHVHVVPTNLHRNVAALIDDERDRWPILSWLPDCDSEVAHSPVDGSPITFGSMLLMGAICVAGLTGMVCSSQNHHSR
jgi:hypothetical protein